MLDFVKNIALPFKIPTPDKTIKIAITGLSRSGKTVFLTSLINQLIANDKINYVNEKLGRSFVARLLPPDSVYVRFDYYNKLKALRSQDPKWPKSTKSVSKTTVQLEFKSEYAFLENQVLNLELLDYPGEWLMDLSMLSESYESWSQQMITLSKEAQRKPYAQEWLSKVKEINSCVAAREDEEEQLFDLYSEYLKNLYYHGFSFAQPGRFIEPGDMKDDPMLLFCPLPKPVQSCEDDALYNLFKKRYDRYVQEVVKRLYLEHFEQFDMQIILVDLVKTLNLGEEVFDDMHLAFKHILKTFTYGSNNLFSKFFNLKIDQVLFAATKADHIPSSQHESYKQLLEQMIWGMKQELDVKHIDTDVTIFSAVKSTQFVKAEIDGVELDCVRGIVLGEHEPSTHYPGKLPKVYTDQQLWREGNFNFVSFKPISFPQRDTHAVEHIRMDRLIYTVLKDHV
ncbi:MAG: YcjX family protein [Epsilonproteobacteria bacterium]|nr:YcjX family protein [Campylobacterota bacterium]